MEHPLLLSAPRPAQQASRRYRRLRHPRRATRGNLWAQPSWFAASGVGSTPPVMRLRS